MSRDEIINSIYTHPEVKSLCRSMTKGKAWKDLLQYVALVLCELPEESLRAMCENKRLNNYIYGIVRNQVMNPRSEFNKAFRPVDIDYRDELDHNIEDDGSNVWAEMPELKDFIRYCRDSVDNDTLTDSQRLSAEISYYYLTYQPIKRRTYRDFYRASGIHYSSVCVYLNTMKKLFRQQHEDKGNTQLR